VVYDSRSGAVIEHQVGRAGKAVLEYLAKPTRIEDLVKVFASLDGPGVLDEIARLEEKNLIFKEQDRVFSLVLDSEHGSQRAKHVAAAVPARGPEVHAAP
jgi:hypothetical protein